MRSGCVGSRFAAGLKVVEIEMVVSSSLKSLNLSGVRLLRESWEMRPREGCVGREKMINSPEAWPAALAFHAYVRIPRSRTSH